MLKMGIHVCLLIVGIAYVLTATLCIYIIFKSSYLQRAKSFSEVGVITFS